MNQNSNNSESKSLEGILHLIPVPLAPNAMHFLPAIVLEKAPKLKYYFVEQIRTARRFLKDMDKHIDIDAIHFSEINQHQRPDVPLLEKWLKKGFEVGVMSEAGCPGVADPGSILVAKAHELGAKVVPYPGPNSMLLALMASGFNGQCYRFVGYLPVKQPVRNQAIKEMEQRTIVHGETQIFMETPYRNNQLLQEVIRQCKDNTLLGIAAEVTSSNEFIKTQTIKDWKQLLPDLHKRPTIFTLMTS